MPTFSHHRPIRSLLAAVAVAAVTAVAFLTHEARADNFRNIHRGEPFPAFTLPAIDGSTVSSESLKGSVTVIVCLSAEQRRSELAAMDSDEVVRAIGSEQVKLVHVTADAIHKAYFERFRQERGIRAPLAIDADRTLYAKLGLIVFPTTAIVGKDGRLAHVLSLHDTKFKHVLDAELRHTLGLIGDEELAKRIAEQPTSDSSPKSVASAHRALARSLRDKDRLDAAKDELKKALELDPENREISLDLAELALIAKEYDAADAYLQQVLTGQPENRRAKQLKGISLYRRGKLDEAKATLEEALALNPNPEQVHYYLGLIYEAQGNAAKAMEHYREAARRALHETGAATPAS